jgi:acyl dehydratase
MSALTGIEIGAELPTQTFQLDRVMLSNYAKASGDLNPIHLDEAFAKSVQATAAPSASVLSDEDLQRIAALVKAVQNIE